MADKELYQLTGVTPTLTDITVSAGPSGGAEVNKSTWTAIKDLFKASYDFLYQPILVSGTNIKTVNSTSLLGSGNISIPTLTDGDKGDLSLSSSATVWTIDNDAVTFSKMQNITGDRILGRISGASGDLGELTGTQVNTLLPDANTSLGGKMSASDKTKIDSLRSTGKIYVSVTETVVSNTTIATTVGTVSIPANYLSTGGIRVSGYLTFSSIYSDSKSDFLVGVNYGGATVCSMYVIDRDYGGGDEQGGWFECIIYGTAGSSQSAYMQGNFSKLSNTGSYFRPIMAYNNSGSSIDSTISQTLDVFLANGFTSTFVTSKCKYLLIEKI